MAVSAPKTGAGTGPNRHFSVLLWEGWTTELTVSVLVACFRDVLAFASSEGLLGSILSISGGGK